jgi:shikimate dehydrogenase
MAYSEKSVIYSAADFANSGQVFRELSREDKPCPARLAVFGDPIAHSLSPQMHNAALEVQAHEFQYVRILVTTEELGHALTDLSEAGFIGVNLTIPHKQAALEFVDEITDQARLMGSINTIAVTDGKLQGHNTDGPGFVIAVQETLQLKLSDQRVLILGGGGGAGRAISVQCALEGCPQIYVANRTLEKAEILSEQVEESLGKIITPISLVPEALENALESVNLIVHATSLGMKESDPSPIPDGLLTRNHFVYDTVYSGGKSALIRQAEAAGAKNANGLSMLLQQGALAYEIWLKEPAPVEVMRKAL